LVEGNDGLLLECLNLSQRNNFVVIQPGIFVRVFNLKYVWHSITVVEANVSKLFVGISGILFTDKCFFFEQVFGKSCKYSNYYSQPIICNKKGEWKIVVVHPNELKYARALELLKEGQVFDANFVKTAIASCSSKPTNCTKIVVDWSELKCYTG